ncbi:MAG: type II toxin-antitoxin system RelE/ParE family toxin [Desulfuromonadaceae bacterium]|nr:type II toxin-antitoxin system RelE/ParE family toxin [Desulfuromonadaceae bacterium]
MKIRWLDAAVDDLVELRDYIGRDNQQAAQEISRRLRDAINALPAHPAMGRPGRLYETRELVIPGSPYIIPYRVRDNTIEILRVLHTARQWPQHNH